MSHFSPNAPQRQAAPLIAVLAVAASLCTFAIARAQAGAAVTLAPIPPLGAAVGDTVSFTASATDSDASGTIAYGLSGAPGGAAIDQNSGAFSWDTSGASAQTYSFSVTAAGSTGGSDSQPVSISVSGASSSAPVQTQAATSTQGTGGVATSTGGTVQTDNATASTTVDNQLNMTIVDPDQPGSTNSSTITASSSESGILGSDATSSATTGDNIDTGGSGANTIVTGNAVSTANVINEVNTNIFNSSGLIIFLNQLFGGGIDLNAFDLSYFLSGSPGNSPTINPTTGAPQCSLLTCLNSSQFNVLNTNDATVTNSVIVRSATGGNTASSTGSTDIKTGSAYAAANVLNLVNTNIVNSSYLLVSFNNFGDLAQNITLPSAGFFQQLFQHGGTIPNLNSSTYAAKSGNAATTTGSVSAEAGTGDNIASSTTATSSAPGQVSAGDAYSSASTFDQSNTNNFGGTSVFLLFRIWGSWSGSIVGLPDGLTATTTPAGLEIVSTDASTSALALSAYAASSTFNSSSFLAAATNTAAIENNIDVSAQTGGNTASSETGTSSIATGNAYAAASVVNLVNTNIVGQNWIFAVFNIFGNFSGDIRFGGGSPSLGLIVDASNKNPDPGSTVDYTFTVSNTGNADATNVVLNASYAGNMLTFDSGGSNGASTTATGESWNLGTILEGQTRAFTFTARVSNVPAGSSVSVPMTATVLNDSITAPTPSGTAQTSITVSSPIPAGSGGGGGGGGGGGPIAGSYSSSPLPKLTVVKTLDVSTTSAPRAVNYKVVVQDDPGAGPAYGATLTDTLTDPSGATMYTRSWELDTISPGDQITLTYAVAFGTSTKPGLYTNSAVVRGVQGYLGNRSETLASASGTVFFAPNGFPLDDASSSVDIATSTLATSTASLSKGGVCAPLITGFLGRGRRNDRAQVAALQSFLSAWGTSLPASGWFGPKTASAVRKFQLAYAQDILAPIGLTRPTGGVYGLTLKKINGLSCSQKSAGL